ncbi:hypothetical protein AB0L63_22510 [Nocardia sp. NPDC051990]|uniref:hypothetical protein n=1 Tax=Nocardia sp. NPDC051990 TaxID=3155285 RepID=UPI0034356580
MHLRPVTPTSCNGSAALDNAHRYFDGAVVDFFRHQEALGLAMTGEPLAAVEQNLGQAQQLLTAAEDADDDALGATSIKAR